VKKQNSSYFWSGNDTQLPPHTHTKKEDKINNVHAEVFRSEAY
jgi:hypothetical protein